MSLPKEPRQKMINMMYLVLTALLALNVSAEILNAFKTVNRSLMIATAQAENQNTQAFRFFEDYSKLPEKRDQAAYYEQLAKKAKTLSDDVYNYLEGLKEELKKESGLKKNEKGEEEYNTDNLDAATRLLVGEGEGENGKGKELLAKLKAYKDQLLQINDSMKAEIENGLPIDLTLPQPSESTPDNAKTNWSYLYFHMTPTIAAVTILSKFQNDIRNSEAKAVEYFLKRVGSLPNPPTDQSVMVLGSANKLYPGEELTITAGVGAFSKTALPSVSVDGASASVNSSGVAEYKLTAGAPGTYSKRVTVTYKDLKGVTKSETKVVEYTVGVAAGLTVSTDKTRVFYIGLDNPLSVTGAVGTTKLSVNVSGPVGPLVTIAPGSYTVKPTAEGTATVTVSDGKNTRSIPIKIKRIPDPKASLQSVDTKDAAYFGGVMSIGKFQQIDAFNYAQPEDFIFDGVNFTVTRYTIICRGGKNFSNSDGVREVAGSQLDPVKSLINSCTQGSTVIFTNIYVSGPGGTRKLKQDLVFALQ
jgi:gliding motility-associated protein GldM